MSGIIPAEELAALIIHDADMTRDEGTDVIPAAVRRITARDAAITRRALLDAAEWCRGQGWVIAANHFYTQADRLRLMADGKGKP